MKKSMIRSIVCALFVMASTTALAHGGFHGGGFHGGGGWHGGGWHGGGWHGGGWHGGGWGRGWGGGWNGVGWGGGYAPAYYGGCQTIRVCNRYGNCWLRNSCY